MSLILRITAILFMTVLMTYSCVGVSTRVDEIKEEAPEIINSRNWEILRYEGYQLGSWANHGGKVWYHVKDSGHVNTYYRVYITKWGGELHFNYGSPETLNRVNLDSANGSPVLSINLNGD
jgi:hypothetical protein